MKQEKFVAGIVMACLLLTLLAGTAAAEKVLKLGVMGPFTGPAAQTGKEMRVGTEMAFEEIDYKIGDYKVVIVWIDSQSDPAKATNAYAEAVERGKIQAGFLNWHSSVAVAVMDVAAKYEVPHFFGFGATKVVNEKYNSDKERYKYWTGKGWPDQQVLCIGFVQALNDAVQKGLWKPKNRRVAVWAEDTDAGRNEGAGYVRYFKESGWEIVHEDYFPITQTDFYPLLSKYRKGDIALMVGTSTAPPSLTALIKQKQEVQLDAVMIANGLGWSGDWYKMTGAASDGVLDMIPKLASKEAKTWAAMVEKKYGFKPSPSACGLTYDGARFLIKIFKRAYEKHGRLDKGSILDIELNEVDTGKLTYSKADGAIIMNMYQFTDKTMPDMVVDKDHYLFPVLQYRNGEGQVIFPPEWAATTFKE